MVSTRRMTLSLDDVLSIEDKFDLYEKVSLVYLLYDDPQNALQDLNKLQIGGSEKLLYNWAINKNLLGQKWQEQFVEAITIIQNYQVLKCLGFEKKDLNERFLPRHMFASLSVNKVRKALYFLCESLVRAEVENILKLVMSDFDLKKLSFKIFDSLYLEMYLLHWETVGYIKPDNLNNLYTVLKQLEYFDLCDSLKQVVPLVSNQTTSSNQRTENTFKKSKTVDAGTNNMNHKKKSTDIFEGILNNASSLMDLVTMESPISADNAAYVSEDNKYNIDPNNPGVCLIINQEHFYTEVNTKFKHLLPSSDDKLDPRIGTKKDKNDLEDTFKMFGFKTIVVDNLTHTEMTEKIGEVIQSITDESSIFICIMSHGDEGIVYGVNSCEVRVRAIQHMMCQKNRSNLSGKPKILILQSCQGRQCQKISSTDEQNEIATDGPTSSKQEMVPPRADLCTFWATVPGYGAIRNKRTGSWFIQSLCDKMKNLGNKYHFEDICTTVIGDVSGKKWCQQENAVAMVPLKDSTLRKLLYLPPIKLV